MDKFKLIAEVRKIPALWDINSEEHRFKRIHKKAWKDLAVTMGSDVTANDCSRMWRCLRDRNRIVVKKIKLRIEKDKLNGTYDPNNEYKCQWVFYEHMKFVNDIKKSSPTDEMDENNSLVEREMSNAMDKLKLIAEVRKRPALWDIKSEEHKSKIIHQKAWKDLAVAMGSDASDCRRMWKYLRDRNRIVVKKIEFRIQEAKLKGSYNPNNDYTGDWTYFKHMKFINDIKQPSPMKLGNSSVNDNKSDGNDSNQVFKVHNMDSTKMEPERDLEMSKVMDKFKLIAEVRKRPALWDIKSEEHKSKIIHQKAWKDLAVAMGSDVTANDCSRMWKSVRNTNRVVAKKIKLRIAKDKFNGTYDPNNEYKCQWVFYEHMKFINDIKKSSPTELNDNKSNNNDSNLVSKSHKMGNTKMDESNSLVEREMSNAMDKLKLIAEVRKRPALWDIKSEEHRSCLSVPEVWKDLAVSMGSDANDCRRMWKYLRDMNRVVVKKIELRIKQAKLKGSYNSNNDYSSHWPYLAHMKFINDIKQPSSMKLGNSSVNDNKSDGNDSNQVSKVHNMDSTKMEPERDLEMSKVMDKFKLIAEMRTRPALWDNQSEEHRSCLSVPEVWKDLAVSMGSDVEKCQRNWVHLCKSYQRSVKRIESRIQEDKWKGSYDPNNDYSSKWAYFEPMEFMKDNTTIHNTSSIKFRTLGEKLKLISEVRKRPELWCIKSKEYRPRLALQKSWEDLARAMGADVTADDCKRKWTSLLLAQLTEVKKLELRIKEDKLKDSYNPNNEYRSKWFLYEHMKFCDDIKNPSLMELGNTSVNDNNSDDNDSNHVSEFQNMDNYKMEPQLDLEPEVYIPDDEDYDTDSQMSAMEFLSEPNSPQNYESADDKPSSTSGYCTKQSYDQANLLEDIKKEDSNLPKSAKLEPELDLDPEVYIPDDEDDDTDSQMSGMEFLSEPNSPQNQESADDKPSSTGGNCTKRPYDQLNCLEDLEKDEHNLIKPVRSNEMVPVTDSDYNFLVSFLPKMKKINELQNLQFRAKITDLMLDIARE